MKAKVFSLENSQKMMLENYKDMIVEYNEKMESIFTDKIKSFKFQKEALITKFGKDRVEKFFDEIDKNFSKIELPKEELWLNAP